MNGFRANRSGIGQMIYTPGEYVKVLLPQLVFGTCWDVTLSRLTPPQGVISLGGQVWVSEGFGFQTSLGYANAVAKVIKNAVCDPVTGVLLSDTDVAAGIGCNVGTFPGTIPIPVPPIVDYASGTDYYELFLFATSDIGQVCVDGNPAHSWLCGTW